MPSSRPALPAEVVELERISDYPHYWAERHPGREAVVAGGRRLTYRAFAEAVDLCARALLANGVAKGDRIAVLSTLRPEVLVLLLGAARIGAMFTGLNLRFRRDEYRYVVGDARPRLLFSLACFEGRDYAADLAALASEFPFVERIVMLDDGDYAGFLADADRVDAAAFTAARDAVGPADPAILGYSSGSTGQPKGAMVPHGGLAHCHRNQCEQWWAEPLRVLNNLPISNLACTGDIFCYTLVGGGTAVLMERFDAAAIPGIIEREGVTVWGQIPTMFQLTLADPGFRRHDLSSLQLIVWLGARAPRDLIARLAEITPNLSCNYGLTETVAGVTYAEVGAPMEVLAETCGKPDPRYELRVVDADGGVLGDGEPGEIQVRGKCRMVGYLNRPEATAETIDGEGWVRTGDVGLRRDDGNYQIAGRLKEMYKSGGYNIYPREIEIVLESHPAVAMAAVIGVADELYGEVGRAYLLLERDGSLEQAEIEAYCRERLANYKVPKGFEIRRDLPTLPVGKIDKQALAREADV